ncbi:MAG: hypothetical protein GIW99_07935 [Candidatus Eremiobacteraeota bacterium]|nr:hypothetical protein [Candidatus Eremiobacteraeota bacterium]MBC5827592.1 hypothetical protein [Candidatus Eremiobacteraeota bacterium]
MFFDRRSAGFSLASRLREEPQPVVVGIARGGTIVGSSVATALGAALDVLVIRKIGHPLQPELAIGAVSSSGDRVTNEGAFELEAAPLEALFAQRLLDAQALAQRLREGAQPVPLRDRTAIIVDDGIATSATMRCAVAYAKRSAARVVCASPVGPASCIDTLARQCDRVVALNVSRTESFAVSRYYVRFDEVSEDEVRKQLRRAAQRNRKSQGAS